MAPTGKQASYASRAYACYVLAEKGDDTPRSLSLAFLRPVAAPEQGGIGEKAVAELLAAKENIDTVYGLSLKAESFNVFTGKGSLAGLCEFAAKDA